MPKISKQMQGMLVVLALVGGVGYVMSSGSDAPPPTHKPHIKFGNATTGASDSSGILPEDLTAHFDRYPGGGRNPFMPVITAGTSLSGGGGKSSSTWALTGIDSIDGATTALVENSSTGDSVFLKAGDHWNGLKVVSIGSQSATFEDSYGKITQLSFADQVPDSTDNANTPVAPLTQPNTPFPVSGSVPTGGIPPFPVTNVAPINQAPQN